MAELYRVRCDAVDGAVATLRVDVLYLGCPLAPSPSLAFGFVYEGWYFLQGMTRGTPYLTWPGGSGAEATRLAEASAFRAALGGYEWHRSHAEEPRAGEFLATVEVTEIDDAGNNDDYLWDGRSEDPAWVKPTPYAVYRVTMTDAKWIDWLRPGMTWLSRSYPLEPEYQEKPSRFGRAEE